LDLESESQATGGCFSGETVVLTEDRGKVLMKDLQLGDRVLASHHHRPTYAPVYSFVHKHDYRDMEFLQIIPSMLEVTHDHMIFIQETAQAIPASSLQVGDQLSNGEVIVAIRKVTRRGVYAPLTSSGSLLVNDVLVSNYIAFQGSEYYTIGAMRFSYHWLSHIFNFPYRFWCTHVGLCLKESYTEFGISTRVDLPYQAIQWWFDKGPQNSWMIFFATPLLILIFSVLAFLQFTLEDNIVVGIITLSLLCIFSFRMLITNCSLKN